MTEPLIPKGCILIARKLVESEIWDKPPLYIKVWMYLLIQAQHKEYKGLKRGQVSTSIPEIIEAVAWRVGARKERPTKDQIFQIIDWLRSTKTQRSPDESNAKATMITTTKATQSMLINIDSYSFHQDIKNYESNDESNDEKATKPPRKQRKADNINKNVKNDNNDMNGQEEVIEQKTLYLDKILLSQIELSKLVEKYGNEEAVERAMEKLNNYLMANSKKKYDSHYHVLIGWVFDDFEKNKAFENRGQPKSKGTPPSEIEQFYLRKLKEEQENAAI